MDEDAIYLCDSAQLGERGAGVRFNITAGGADASGFAVRFGGVAYAYLNRCAHVPVELDWEPGKFFDMTGLYLMCSTHGAIYVPETGRCAGGPCRGGRLRPIALREIGGKVYWLPDEYIRPVLA